MSSSSSSSSDEKVTSSDKNITGEGDEEDSPLDRSLPARYAETMRMHSRLSRANEPSLSSRVLLLGFMGLLFYFALRSKWQLRILKAQLDPTELDKDYTGLIEEYE